MMDSDNLTGEQWKELAEKLSDYLERACMAHTCCDDCELNHQCKFEINWMEQARKNSDMRKPKSRKARLYHKLLEEKKQLEREKAWLIKQLKNITYSGVPVAPPGGPIGCTWEEAATLACLPEDKKKNFKTKLSITWEEIYNDMDRIIDEYDKS